MSKQQFSGIFTALATPMKEGAVNYNDLETLIQHQIKGDIHGIVSVGTSGESPTLTTAEHLDVIQATIQASGSTPVYAGTGSNSTEEAVNMTRKADALGADGFLIVAPYYNKPNDEGMFLHFSKIAEVTEKPIMLYSIPSRCGIEISVDTAARLYEKYPHVCSMKAAEGSSEKVIQYVNKLGPDYAVLSGDDGLTLPFMAAGATGVVSVASNLIVKPLVDMVNAANSNDFDRARTTFLKYIPFFKVIFEEPNPVPIKYALQKAGIIQSAEVRLPLAPIAQSTCHKIDKVLTDLSIV